MISHNSVMAEHTCALCDSVVLAGKRHFLKNSEAEPVLSFKNLLLRWYSTEDVDRFFVNRVVVCKGPCLSTLKKLAKLQKDLSDLENEVKEKMDKGFMHHSSTQIACSPVRRGRRNVDILEGNIINRTVSLDDSPVVSVSLVI